MNWTVRVSNKAAKKIKRLPKSVLLRFDLLAKEIEVAGPVRKNWKNFSRLKGQGSDIFHCHIKSGRPTYVACWEVLDKEIRLLEVYYVGTHEKAPY